MLLGASMDNTLFYSMATQPPNICEDLLEMIIPANGNAIAVPIIAPLKENDTILLRSFSGHHFAMNANNDGYVTLSNLRVISSFADSFTTLNTPPQSRDINAVRKVCSRPTFLAKFPAVSERHVFSSTKFKA